jgi:hypothetical protein
VADDVSSPSTSPSMSGRPRRRTFAPVVLLGIAGAVLAAVAGTKDWSHPASTLNGSSLGDAFAEATASGAAALDAPAVTALALVSLAAWGVVLVTRGRARRLLAAFTALASAGAVACAIGRITEVHGPTAWVWLGLIGTIVTLAAAAAAVALAPTWPEMGRKYDTPEAGTGRDTSRVDPRTAENLDIWTSITQGNDPTAERSE